MHKPDPFGATAPAQELETLHLDFETYNTLELGDCGASKYSKGPDLEVLIVAWAIGDEDVKSVRLPGRNNLPKEILDHIQAGGKIAAHNATFELAILRNYFGVEVPIENVICTMQRCLYGGYPKSLGEAGRAAGASEVKDEAGKKVMQQLAKPRKATKKRPASKWHEDQPEKLDVLEEYCRQDVRAERALDRMLPATPPSEITIARLDRAINQRGLRFDRRLIESMIKVVESTGLEETARVAEITGGLVTNVATQAARVMEWLAGRGPDSLGKDIVAEFIDRDDVDPEVRLVLEARIKGAKASVAKLYTALDWMEEDDRARGLLQYYGARTGRWSGQGFQPQNIAKSVLDDDGVETAIRGILAGATAQQIEAKFEIPPLAVISSCLRGTIVPSEGHVFFAPDLNAIEARTACYLAGQEDLLEAFCNNVADIYMVSAHLLGFWSDQREAEGEGLAGDARLAWEARRKEARNTSKAAVLGLGYGMGAARFIDYAKTMGATLDYDRAEEVVRIWRRSNHHIVRLWGAIEEAIKAAMASFAKDRKPVARHINKYLSIAINIGLNGQPVMTIALPSGRRLFYRNIRFETDPMKGRPSLAFDGVDKKWKTIFTYAARVFENINQAFARDVMCSMMQSVEESGAGRVVATVHDEVIIEIPEASLEENLQIIDKCMNTPPTWAPTLPVKAKGGVLRRYAK